MLSSARRKQVQKKMMNFKHCIFSLTAGFLVFMNSAAVAQPVDEPAYCPDTVTDADGDGLGMANGQPCRALRSANVYPVCSSPVIATDPDRDGWGWEDGQTCLIDNTRVERNFVITDANGVVSTGVNVAPLIGSYVKSLGHFSSSVEIASDGTLYYFQVPNRRLAAADTQGNTLWEVSIYEFVSQIALDESEQTLYAVLSDDGQVAAYSVSGTLLWESVRLGRIRSIQVGQDAIIVGLASETDTTSSRPSSVVSLALDGSMRWKFAPGGNIDHVTLGRDNGVYVKYLSDPYGNETTFILAQ